MSRDPQPGGETGHDLSLQPVLPFGDFREASSAVLQLLQERIGLGLWLLTRTAGEDWIVLNAEDRGYGVEEGHVFRWSDSFCSRMVKGLGPRIAPRSTDVPVYAAAPVAQQVPIAAYVGVPINRSDGTLFGTLCAIDPEPQPASLERHLPTLEMYSRLLASILESELRLQDETRRAELAECASETDPLTGAYNRRGWDRLCAAEEVRCRRYGNPGAVVVLDIDNLKKTNDLEGHQAGDELLKRVAEVIRGTIRKSDIVARWGGDEFGVLAVEESREGLQVLVCRLEAALKKASIAASVGGASRDPKSSFEEAVRLADEAMYRKKRARREGQGSAESGMPDRSPSPSCELQVSS